MIDIICCGGLAIFEGSPKKWRSSFTQTTASYLIDPMNSAPKCIIQPTDTSCLPGHLLWFGTQPEAKSIYGPCVFELDFSAVLEAYTKCRGISSEQVCYRAANTLVYQREVSHVVLVCSNKDDGYYSFPLIQGNNTKYFIPPGRQNPPSMTIKNYASQCDLSGHDCTRHEHVIMALHLPPETQLVLPKQQVSLSIIEHGYCIKSIKSKKSHGDCSYAVDRKTMETAITEWMQYRKWS